MGSTDKAEGTGSAAGGLRHPDPRIEGPGSAPGGLHHPLSDAFQRIVDSLPDDWTDLVFDLRIADESRYIDASVYLATCNAQPYSRHDWHWRLLVAHRFGHAAAAPAVHAALSLLDEAGIVGELALREHRCGRVEVTQMWGRPQSVREEMARLRAQ